MKLIVASVVLIGTVSATKTGRNVHAKDNTVAGLRGGVMHQKERKAQGMGMFGDDADFNLEEFFGGSSSGGGPASPPPNADSDMDGAADGDSMGMGGMQGGMGGDGASSFPDTDSILDQIGDMMGDVLGGFGGGENNDTMSDLGLGGLFEDMGLPDVSDLDMSGLLDGFGGSSSVQSDTEEASGLSILGQLVGGFDCPDTCDKSLCNDIMMGTADRNKIGEACNTGCLPVLEQSCDEACGNQNGPGPADLAMFTDMACKSCEFLTCCAEEVDQVELGPKFDTCQTHLPETSQFLADMVVSAQEWVDNMDLDAIWESMGLNDIFEDLQTIFDESMANSGSMPDSASCDPNTCPIAGLCEMNIDYASIKPDEICSSDAFYKCGQGLRDMCEQCNEDGGLFCSFCRIAMCCEEAGENASFQECALNSPLADVVVQDDADAAPDEDSVTEVDNSEPLPEDQVKPESPEVETAVEDSIPEPESEFDEIEIVEAPVEETDIDVESSETPEEDTTATAPDDQSANASEDPSAGQVPFTPVQVVSANEYTAAGSYYSIATSMCAVVASVLYIVSF